MHGMICLVSCEQSDLCPSPATSPVQTTEQLYTRTQCTALIMSPPPTVSSVQDNITNNHIRPEIPRKVKQQHDSSRQVRVMMGGGRSLHQLLLHVPLMPGRPPGQAQLWAECVCQHNFRYPREQGVEVPPDTTHGDWITIPGATIRELSYAWRLDYQNEVRPQRILLIAGLRRYNY